MTTPRERFVGGRLVSGHCGCDVEAWTAADAGHGLAVHSAMPAFTDEVIRWPATKGLAPTP